MFMRGICFRHLMFNLERLHKFQSWRKISQSCVLDLYLNCKILPTSAEWLKSPVLNAVIIGELNQPSGLWALVNCLRFDCWNKSKLGCPRIDYPQQNWARELLIQNFFHHYLSVQINGYRMRFWFQFKYEIPYSPLSLKVQDECT